MTDFNHLSTVEQCRTVRICLGTRLAVAESRERRAQMEAKDARKIANKVVRDICAVAQRLQDVCVHPEKECRTATTYGFSITTCNVCKSMMKVHRDPSQGLWA